MVRRAYGLLFIDGRDDDMIISGREHVKANLARHKVPCDVAFIDTLPRNATGRLLRAELA